MVWHRVYGGVEVVNIDGFPREGLTEKMLWVDLGLLPKFIG